MLPEVCESVHIAGRLHLLPAISVERYGHGRGQTAADYGQLWLERLSTIGLYNKEGGSMVIFFLTLFNCILGLFT